MLAQVNTVSVAAETNEGANVPSPECKAAIKQYNAHQKVAKNLPGIKNALNALTAGGKYNEDKFEAQGKKKKAQVILRCPEGMRF